jgi:arginase
VTDAGRGGRVPLLVGADCPVILGCLAAIRDRGERPGLVMVDGHEDAWPPEPSETGEASDSEVAIALGEVDHLPPLLDELMPVLDAGAIAQLGPRDADEIAAAGVASLRDRVAYFVDGEHLHGADVERSMQAALAAVSADGLWIHIDLDVLATDAIAAVDYPQPGGITWDELDRLAAGGLQDPRCRGVSVAIYNPALDPERRDAQRVIDFLARLAAVRPLRPSP